MPSFRRSCPVVFACVSVMLLGRPLRAAEEPTDADRGAWESFSQLVDRLPTFISNNLPGFDNSGAVKFYSHPHIGDFFRAGYIRLPVGVKAKIGNNFDANVELQGYTARGIDTTESRSGLSNLNVGAKCEHLFNSLSEGGFGLGFNYRTPLSGQPARFSDGYRHFQPYVSMTRMVVPRWKLLGYSSVGLNLLERAQTSRFGRNQLHGNSIMVIDGIAREFSLCQLSLTARYATTGLITDEFHQNFSLRPEIVVPWRLHKNARSQIFFSFNTRVMWGPDGRQISTGSGVRLQLHLDRNRSELN